MVEKIKGENSWKVSEHDEFAVDEEFLKELETANLQEQAPILTKPKKAESRKPVQKEANTKTRTNKKKLKTNKQTAKKRTAKKVTKKKAVKKKAVVSKKTSKNKKDDKMAKSKKSATKKKAVAKKKIAKKVTKKKAVKKKVVKAKVTKPKGEPKRKPVLRTNAKKKNKKEKTWLKSAIIIAAAIILLALIIFGIFKFNNYLKFQEQEKLLNNYNENMSIVVAKVNSDDISLDTFNTQSKMLPADYQVAMTKQEVLDQMIDEQLLVQDAIDKGYKVSNKEVEEEYKNILISSETTELEMMQKLGMYGIDKFYFYDLIERQELLQKYFADTIDKVAPTEEKVKAYYDTHPEEFSGEEQVTVKHILIRTGDVRNDTEARTLAQSITNELYQGADFCEKVTQYSEDTGSLANCGKYTFGKGVMVPEFEQAAFEMQDGEYRIVKTSYGYHIMFKVSSSNSTIKSYEEVKDSIYSKLKAELRTQAFNELITSLKKDANIKIYLDKVLAQYGESSQDTVMSEEEFNAFVEEQSKIAAENEAVATAQN